MGRLDGAQRSVETTGVPIVIFGQLTIDELGPTRAHEPRVEYAGDAPYTAVGAAIWRRPVGLVAAAADDFDVARLAALERFGIDQKGVRRRGARSIRYRVIYEQDGGRRFEERSPHAAFHQTAPEMADLPEDWHAARGFHVAAMPLESAERIVDGLSHSNPDALVTLDTHEDEVGGRQESLARLLPRLSAFLPSQEEVATLLGFDDPSRAIGELAGLGARVTVIKMGAKGALVHDATADATWLVRPHPGPVVDPTGAGDAFCGGFLAGLSLGDEPSLAARRGAVSASFVIATPGVPMEPPDGADADARLEATRAERLPVRAGRP